MRRLPNVLLRTCIGRRLQTIGAVALLMLVAPAAALAHDGEHASWNVWSDAPAVVLALAVTALLYGRGLWTLWRRAGAGNGVSYGQAAAFGAGLLTLVAALLSPIDFLSGQLLSAHMVQHLLLMLVAAPLLVAGTPLFVMMWALPSKARKRVGTWWSGADMWQGAWHAVSQPLFVWVLYALVLWLWHLPSLYEAALENQWIHDLQHAGFLTAAGLLWWMLLNPMGRRRLGRGAGVLYLFTTFLHACILGVFVTLSPDVWYAFYTVTTPGWGLTPLEDQQLAGAIMWMPAGLVYVVLAAFVFAGWLRETEAGMQRRERRTPRSGGGEKAAEPADLLPRASEQTR